MSGPRTLPRRLLGEALGTGLLVTVVVGSGIAAQTLSPADVGLQLLENSLTTALALTVLILVLAPVSGAHFNPVVTLVDWLLARSTGGGPSSVEVGAYTLAQVSGGVVGALLANAMFDLPVWQISGHHRVTPGVLLGEVVATAGLICVIFALARSGRGAWSAPAVGAYIGAAYWFTSSTSFANPAVTIGRIFSDTFAGIAPSSVAPFLAAQLVGAVLGALIIRVLYPGVQRPDVDQAPPGGSGEQPIALPQGERAEGEQADSITLDADRSEPAVVRE
ncbi:MAG: MIP/aquaporin family protein [Actinomycetales bacterium]